MPAHWGNILKGIMESKNIQLNLNQNLVAIKKKQQIAVFKDQVEETEKLWEVPFDILHVGPPMTVPPGVKNTKVANKGTGLVHVNQYTMQHDEYDNVWAVGDCTNAPKSRTAAACVVESNTLVKNLLEVFVNNGKPNIHYDGYAGCPIFVGDGKLLLAEFGYDGKIMSTFPGSDKPSRRMYALKRYFLPFVYW